ncbi:MAG: hypothetical protein SPK85_00255 [Prevotella sp.]|nr:hypothetical protein [Prevotella sp.]
MEVKDLGSVRVVIDAPAKALDDRETIVLGNVTAVTPFQLSPSPDISVTVKVMSLPSKIVAGISIGPAFDAPTADSVLFCASLTL